MFTNNVMRHNIASSFTVQNKPSNCECIKETSDHITHYVNNDSKQKIRYCKTDLQSWYKSSPYSILLPLLVVVFKGRKEESKQASKQAA